MSNKQSALPTHFTAKPPVTLLFKGSENKPPLKKRKVIESETHASPFNKYENCVFNGNIIKKFYYSCSDHEDCKKKKNMQ